MKVSELWELLKELKEDFRAFKTNDFQHLSDKVDKLLYMIIGTLLGLIANFVLYWIKR